MVLTNKQKYNKKYGFKGNQSHSMEDIAKKTGIKKSILQEVFNRGIGAFKTNRSAVRPSVKSPEQWAYGRLYSFVVGGKTQQTADKDLWEKHLASKKKKK